MDGEHVRWTARMLERQQDDHNSRESDSRSRVVSSRTTQDILRICSLVRNCRHHVHSMQVGVRNRILVRVWKQYSQIPIGPL